MKLTDYPKTIASVNKFLRELGYSVKAVRHPSGYHYWINADDEAIDGAETAVARASDQSYRLWKDDADEAARLDHSRGQSRKSRKWDEDPVFRIGSRR